jgi:FkbM family methyltransferase
MTYHTADTSRFERLLILYARRFPIQRGKLRLIDYLWPAAVGNDRRRIADLKHGGFKIPCDLNELLQRQFYFFGTYFVEEHILACWANAARDAQVILDVGANAGIYSLAALAVQPQATVHAFEPTPETAARLRKAASMNHLTRLHVHQAAVSNQNGHASLIRCRGELGTNEGMNFIGPATASAGMELVPTVCLDHFCTERSIDRVDLLKLDIQGHEHYALAGARELLIGRRVGMIFLELNWAEGPPDACPAAESVRILDEAGYVFSRPGKRLEWRGAGEWLRALTDVIAQPHVAELTNA